MKTEDVTIARVYLSEQKSHISDLMSLLHDQEKVRGVTVFRGIAGFGQSGKMHSSQILDLSLDLPIVVEFFDSPDKVEKILADLHDKLGPGHIVSWPASVNA
jgi:PII-like signaling protein